jgi:DNA-binding MarR family transcriptional regulator
MAESQITGCTCDRLRKLTRRLTQHYDAHLAPAGLRVTQFSLLAHLQRAGPTTISALAELLDMDRTTLTRNLAPLEDAGLVAVQPGADARTRAVAVTERGREAWREARPYWRRAQDEVERLLGPERVAGLHALLEGSLSALRDAAPAARGSRR